jgi:hypothetical protein
MGNAIAGALVDGTATKYVINDAGTGWVAWAQGNNAGAVAAGVTGPTGLQWLHCFVIRKSSDGRVDFGLDSSITAANLCDATWNQYRRVGSVQIVSLGGGKFGIRKFKQYGDEFLWESNGARDYYKTTAAESKENATLAVPLGVRVMARLRARLDTVGVVSGAFIVHCPDTDDVVPSNNDWGGTMITPGSADPHYANVDVLTGVSSEARVAISPTGGGFLEVSLYTIGYLDPRGKN